MCQCVNCAYIHVCVCVFCSLNINLHHYSCLFKVMTINYGVILINGLSLFHNFLLVVSISFHLYCLYRQQGEFAIYRKFVKNKY